MKKIIYLFFLLGLLSIVKADVVINEIMYNPAGNEYDFEYVELYGYDNISGWYFEGIDLSFPDNTSIEGYLVIANTLSDEGEGNDILDRYTYLDCNYEYVGSLLNSGEIIILRDEDDKIVDVVIYDDWVEENHSLERIDIGGYSSDPDNWDESINGGTPGKENSVSPVDGCDWSVQIETEGSVFLDPVFKVKVVKNDGVGKANLTVDKWIENSDGDVYKTYSLWDVENALNYKTSSKYSPSLPEKDAYFIKANITNLSCVDTDSSNNLVSEMIYVKGDEYDVLGGPDSFIDILDVSPDVAEFGDIVKVKVYVYRGDTSKYAVYAYVEDDSKVSEKSTMHLKDKYTDYTVTLPIQIDPNCNKKYDNGKYDVIVEGLDVSDSEEIVIEGITSSFCKAGSISSVLSGSDQNENKNRFDYELISFSEDVFQGDNVDMQVRLENNDDEDYKIEIWSYLYRGSKCYSGKREKNKKSFFLESNSAETISLFNSFEDADLGDYNLKVKIRKNDQKTTNDITEDVKLVAEINMSDENKEDDAYENESWEYYDLNDIHDEKNDVIRWSDILVYESTSFKSMKLMPCILIIILSLLSIVLILSKNF